MVVYFAGHGVIKDFDEVWLLSDAPEDGSAVIGLNSSFRLAKQSGIPNITFVSDACRSLPTTLAQLQISPASIFPTLASSANLGKVDRLFATQISYTAAEFEIESEYQGVFTSTLMKAFKVPDQSMITAMPDGEKVIPNRRLEAYLLREVPKLAQTKDFRLKQIPECDIPSSDEVYLARVADGTPVSTRAMSMRKPTRNDVNSSELGGLINMGLPAPSALPSIRPSQATIDIAAVSTGFKRAKKDVLATFDVSNLWQQAGNADAGFVVVGRNVNDVAVPRGAEASFVNDAPHSVVSIKLARGSPACSVAMRFEDGTGVVYAALRDFVGTVSATENAITNVAYDPLYAVGHTSDHVKELRATAAAAFQFGVLRFRGSTKERQMQAIRFGETIRQEKATDPTLGIYAAYALDEASDPERVKSVRRFMRDDLQVDIFDVAMLAGETVRNAGTGGIVPCCPMLSIGWSYIASAKVTLQPFVAEAQTYLIPSPWSYFRKEGMDLLLPAIKTWQLD